MKYIWEEEDFKSGNGNGSVLAISPGGETCIITRKGCVSLIDGNRWLSDLDVPTLIAALNEGPFIPILDQVNAHNLVAKHPRLRITR